MIKIKTQGSFALFFALALVLCHAAPAFAAASEDTHSAGVVYNEEELAAWLAEHDSTGGIVTLGSVVTVTQYLCIGRYAEAPITIDTGAFGLVFNGGFIDGLERFSITGEGVEMPVLDVLRTGGDYYWEPSRNLILMALNITAVGRDGQGGTALRILGEDSKAFRMDILPDSRGVIRSYGAGAVGIWLDAPADAYCYEVEVFGENSHAVYAPAGARLFYCRLTAQGNSAGAVSGTNLLLDTCAVSPEPEQAASVNRRVLETSLNQLYLPVKLGEPDPYSIQKFSNPAFFLSGGDGFSDVTRHFAVYWDFDFYDTIDTGVTGKTVIPGKVSPLFSGLGLFDEIALGLTVEVRDPALPCINQVGIFGDGEGRFARLHYWDSFDPQAQNAVLWRSDDEGTSWQDITRSPNILWGGDCLEFPTQHLKQPVWLQLEMTGTGESNIVILYEKDGITYGGSGGDRTGTDREGVSITGGEKPGSESGNTPNPDQNGKQPENNGSSIPDGAAGNDTNKSETENNGDKTKPGRQPENTKSSEAGQPNSDPSKSNTENAEEAQAALMPEENSSPTEPASQTPSGSAATRVQKAPESGKQTGAKENALPLTETKKAASAAVKTPLSADAVSPFDPEQSAPDAAFGKWIVFGFLGLAFLFAAAIITIKLLVKGR